MKRFGEIFGESWREYKSNFKVFLIIFLLLSVIPVLVYYIATIPLSLEFLKLGESPGFSDILSIIFQLKYLIPAIIFWIVLFVFSILMSVSFIYNSLYRKKQMSVGETLAGGKKYFWRYFLFSVVSGIFLFGLFLLFLIPGLIFLIFWTFAAYILVGENKGILESLGRSHDIVKGRWWRVFGFALLFGLIIIGISIVFSIAGGIVSLVIKLLFTTDFPYITLVTGFIKQLFSLGGNLIIIPLSMLFFKNFYLDMKSKRK